MFSECDLMKNFLLSATLFMATSSLAFAETTINAVSDDLGGQPEWIGQGLTYNHTDSNAVITFSRNIEMDFIFCLFKYSN